MDSPANGRGVGDARAPTPGVYLEKQQSRVAYNVATHPILGIYLEAVRP